MSSNSFLSSDSSWCFLLWLILENLSISRRIFNADTFWRWVFKNLINSLKRWRNWICLLFGNVDDILSWVGSFRLEAVLGDMVLWLLILMGFFNFFCAVAQVNFPITTTINKRNKRTVVLSILLNPSSKSRQISYRGHPLSCFSWSLGFENFIASGILLNLHF